jgi:hypothetical protein
VTKSPPWQAEGATATTATLSGLALTDGAKYFCAVRALSAGGKSPDALSNGVVVHLPTDAGPPDAGTEDAGPDAGTEDAGPGDVAIRGCSCEEPGAARDLGAGAFLSAAAAAVVMNTRRRSRHQSRR